MSVNKANEKDCRSGNRVANDNHWWYYKDNTATVRGVVEKVSLHVTYISLGHLCFSILFPSSYTGLSNSWKSQRKWEAFRYASASRHLGSLARSYFKPESAKVRDFSVRFDVSHKQLLRNMLVEGFSRDIQSPFHLVLLRLKGGEAGDRWANRRSLQRAGAKLSLLIDHVV